MEHALLTGDWHGSRGMTSRIARREVVRGRRNHSSSWPGAGSSMLYRYCFDRVSGSGERTRTRGEVCRNPETGGADPFG